MEKLLELLNQFEKARIEAVNAKWLPYNIKLSFRPYTEDTLTNKAYKGCQLEICSKYYRFIEWLVSNNKINFLLIPNEIKEIWIPMKINWKIMYWFDSSDYYWLLMLLSIQDNPIEFLCSVLK